MSDRDPLQQLAEFGTGGPVNPLPAAEVRRLGDRRRARRTAVSAVAGATAVLAVAVPAGLYAARDGGNDAPPVGPSPTPSVTSIPDDFPLDRGGLDFGDQQDEVGPSRAAGMSYPTPCGATGIETERASDELRYERTAPEFTDRRELRVFADEASAARALGAIEAGVKGCPQQHMGDGFVQTYTTLEANPGADSFSFAETTEPAGGTVYQYTRVGAAILTVAWPNEGWTPTSAQEGVDDLTDISRGILPEMCLWTDSGCGDEESPSPDSTPTMKEIADDFPLADGFPERSERGEKGYTGPNRTIDPIAYDLCGEPLPNPAFRDRLLAGYESAEDYRTRQLTTYADADAAVAASRAIIQAFRDCPTEGPDSEGYTSEREVQKLTLGGESWAVLDRATFDGGQTPFGGTLIVVRVGRAVLIEDHGGHAGYPTPDGIQELSQRLATPIAAMCAFTVAGCGGGDAEPSETAGTAGGFGPSLGGLRLGEDLAQIESAGWTLTGTGDCRGLMPPGGGHMEGAMYQEGVGVASIVDALGEGTPEGITTGSSKAALRAAYPTATFTGQPDAEQAIVRLDGPGQWEFSLFEGEVVSFALVHDDATCTA